MANLSTTSPWLEGAYGLSRAIRDVGAYQGLVQQREAAERASRVEERMLRAEEREAQMFPERLKLLQTQSKGAGLQNEAAEFNLQGLKEEQKLRNTPWSIESTEGYRSATPDQQAYLKARAEKFPQTLKGQQAFQQAMQTDLSLLDIGSRSAIQKMKNDIAATGQKRQAALTAGEDVTALDKQIVDMSRNLELAQGNAKHLINITAAKTQYDALLPSLAKKPELKALFDAAIKGAETTGDLTQFSSLITDYAKELNYKPKSAQEMYAYAVTTNNPTLKSAAEAWLVKEQTPQREHYKAIEAMQRRQLDLATQKATTDDQWNMVKQFIRKRKEVIQKDDGTTETVEYSTPEDIRQATNTAIKTNPKLFKGWAIVPGKALDAATATEILKEVMGERKGNPTSEDRAKARKLAEEKGYEISNLPLQSRIPVLSTERRGLRR